MTYAIYGHLADAYAYRARAYRDLGKESAAAEDDQLSADFRQKALGRAGSS